MSPCVTWIRKVTTMNMKQRKDGLGRCSDSECDDDNINLEYQQAAKTNPGVNEVIDGHVSTGDDEPILQDWVLFNTTKR